MQQTKDDYPLSSVPELFPNLNLIWEDKNWATRDLISVTAEPNGYLIETQTSAQSGS